MTNKEINEKIAEYCDGWRWWRVSDPLCRGLKFKDSKFDNCVRTITHIRKTYIIFDDTIEVLLPRLESEYKPINGWVKNGVVRITAINYSGDLNEMHNLENTLLDNAKDTTLYWAYSHNLYNVVVAKEQQPFRASARQRAEALLRAFNRWDELSV